MSNEIEILSIEPITADVMRYRTSKPEGYAFKPGQATDVAIATDQWKDEKRPFTFTSLPSEDTLEFTIKHYPDHDGVTEQMRKLIVGDKLLIDDAWGAISYKGKGTFIAGGTGVTPFLAIFKDLHEKDDLLGNRLIFGSKTEADIIADDVLKSMPKLEVVHVLSQEDKEGYAHGRIDKEILAANVIDISKPAYVCGPPPMTESVNEALEELGAEPDSLVFEK